MRRFVVEKKSAKITPLCATVGEGNTLINNAYECNGEKTITLGYEVYELNEGGATNNIEFYNVDTDYLTWSNNAEEVLEQIKADYSADNGWQNNEW